MTHVDTLLCALNFYNIEVTGVSGTNIKLENNFEIEVETNGMYKLTDDGFIVAPFNDVNELCKFILQ